MPAKTPVPIAEFEANQVAPKTADRLDIAAIITARNALCRDGIHQRLHARQAIDRLLTEVHNLRAELNAALGKSHPAN